MEPSHRSLVTMKKENHVFIKILILSEYRISDWGLLASVWWGKYFGPQYSVTPLESRTPDAEVTLEQFSYKLIQQRGTR